MGLKIKNLHVKIKENQREVLKGVNLVIPNGEIHAIMGPNGTGKSTLSQTIMGSPRYQITAGTIEFNGHLLNHLTTDQRARLGLFIGMQYPMEIKGIKNADFIKSAVEATHPNGKHFSMLDFLKMMHTNMQILDMDDSYAERYLNEGFSGGEKKRNEVLQMMMLNPRLAILDEIDSGLDIDALHVVSRGINHMRSPRFGAMIITHYNRILKYVKPDVVHVMMDGRMVTHGGPELANKLEKEGYAGLRDELGLKVKLVDDDE